MDEVSKGLPQGWEKMDMKLLRNLFNDTHPIFKSNIRNIPAFLKSLQVDPSLIKGEVGCIMCTWDEEAIVGYALESSCEFVSRYYIVDKDGTTIQKIKEMEDKLNLDIETYVKPNLNLRESRAYALSKVKEPWIMIQDGDEVFHTDGPQNINNLRKHMNRENVIYCTPLIVLSKDFNHLRKLNPIQPPHPFLYHNNGTISIAKEDQRPRFGDQLLARSWKIGLKNPFKFNCQIKKRQATIEVIPYNESIYGPKPKVLRSIPNTPKHGPARDRGPLSHGEGGTYLSKHEVGGPKLEGEES